MLYQWVNASAERQQDYAAERLKVDVTEKIYEYMERQGVSKAQLAEKLGTSKSNVTQMLSGSRNLTLQSLAFIAIVLGLRVEVTLIEPEPVCGHELPEGQCLRKPGHEGDHDWMPF